MKVIVHIGGEKTGTTSLQVALSRSRDELRRRGVLYPTSLTALGEGNHVKLYCFASEGPLDELKGQFELRSESELEAFRSRVVEDLRSEVEGGNFHTLVLSNEHCSSRLQKPSELERIKALLSAYSDEIRIILYIRPQWDLLISSFSTNVKAGVPNEFGFPSAKELNGKYDYRRIITLWNDVFGKENVAVRRYGSETLKNEDVLAGFAAFCGLGEVVAPVARQNVSLPGDALEFLRRFNAIVPRAIDYRPNPSRGNIVQILETYESPVEFMPDQTVLKNMATWSEPINRWVSENAFGGEPAFAPPLFDERGPRGDDDVLFDVGTAFRIIGFLWEAKQKQVSGLLNRLNKEKSSMGRAKMAT